MFKNVKGSNYPEIAPRGDGFPDFAGFLIPYSLPQQVSCNQHHHDRDCAKDDRPESSTEAAVEGPGHSALWASSL